MLDIIEIAEEKGMEKGKTLGIQEMVVEALKEKFPVPGHISEKIRKIDNPDTLKSLFHQVFKCQNVKEFEAILTQV